MASSRSGVFSALLLIFMAASSTTARQFQVGDDLGWHQPDPLNTDFYTQWAETNRFQIGDSLAFEYQNDSVLTVEKWDYYHCDASDPITAFDNGNSIINLDRAGPFYFISGIHDHCISGQRLIVDVMSPHPVPASPPSVSPAAAPPRSQVGPSPSSSSSSFSSPPSSSPTNSGSESEVSSSVVLRLDFMAILVVFVVIMICA